MNIPTARWCSYNQIPRGLIKWWEELSSNQADENIQTIGQRQTSEQRTWFPPVWWKLLPKYKYRLPPAFGWVNWIDFHLNSDWPDSVISGKKKQTQMYVWKGWGTDGETAKMFAASNPNTDKAHVLIDLCLLNVALWASETRSSLLIRVGMCDYKPLQGKRWSCGGKKAQRELWALICEDKTHSRMAVLESELWAFPHMAWEGISVARLKCVITTGFKGGW